MTQAAVDLVHANDMEHHLWTVNDPTRMQQLIDYGIDGITTDNPALLRDHLNQGTGGVKSSVLEWVPSSRLPGQGIRHHGLLAVAANIRARRQPPLIT